MLFGFGDPVHISVENLTLDRETLSMGVIWTMNLNWE